MHGGSRAAKAGIHGIKALTGEIIGSLELLIAAGEGQTVGQGKAQGIIKAQRAAESVKAAGEIRGGGGDADGNTVHAFPSRRSRT